MTRWENYLLSAEKIVTTYDGSLPLHHFLKPFFKQNPQMGSRDRRWISQLAYAFYRLGHLWKNEMPVKDRLLLGLFLCETQSNDILALLKPEWNELVTLPLPEKLASISLNGQSPTPNDIFPFTASLSEGVDAAAFANAYFVQPHLFIRVRKNKQEAITALLQETGITGEWLAEDMLALPNGTNIETLIRNKEWYEIQDASSQQTGQLFAPKPGQRWWDACAASGGKSLLLVDKEPRVQLTVSDVRISILQNLHERFYTAGIKNYETKALDLTLPVPPQTLDYGSFDGIILDAPCTGSGTWGRSPEHLYFFEEARINTFHNLQKRIAENVVPLLKKGGSLIYITCSAFKQENEAVVKHICEHTGLQWRDGGIITGYNIGADTMFAAKLVK